MKKCSHCKVEKEDIEFRQRKRRNKRGTVRLYRHCYCRICETELGSRNYNENFDDYCRRNSICLIAGFEKGHYLSRLISQMLNEVHVNWQVLKSKKVVYKNQEFDLDMWDEEYMAVIIACIHQHAPFSNRLDYLSVFCNRTHNQVRALLAVHYKRYYAFVEDDTYHEVYMNFFIEIGLYFQQWYKTDYGFEYKDKSGEPKGRIRYHNYPCLDAVSTEG